MNTASFEADAARTHPETILLVDDQPGNLQILMQTLKGCGYRLLIATGGENALAIAEKAHPELILLDIMMPGVDGYEVCKRLKQDPATADTSVIFLSALDETGDKVKGFELGAVDYIAKPFQAEEVIARVDTHLKIRRLERSLSEQNRELERINQRMKRDLEAATRVQQALLPSVLPKLSGIKAAWEFQPCDELAGDALNIYKLDERYVAMYVLDVSGHGVPAALLAVTVTRSLMPNTDRASLVTDFDAESGALFLVSPCEVANRLNAIFQMEQNAMLYFTLVYGVLDTYTNSLRFVAAGHPGPIHVACGDTVRIFDSPAVPIGVLDAAGYQEREIVLKTGDRIFFHSDGVNEERNAGGEEFGRDRVCRVLAESRTDTLEGSLKRLLAEVTAWRGGESFRDDISILALEINGG